MKNIKLWLLAVWDTVTPYTRTPGQSSWSWLKEWLGDIIRFPSALREHRMERENLEELH